MNRLIIVGNGFDLAHGLKTSYKDFIFWYLDRCFGNAGMFANGQVHDDVFLRISVLEHYSLMDLVRLSKGKGLSRYLYENGLLHEYLNYDDHSESSAKNFKESYDKVSIPLSHKVTFKSPFFKRLIDSCLECGWVDIEQEYFDELLNLGGELKEYKDFDSNEVKSLNGDFAYLRAKLEEYLVLQNNSFESEADRNTLKDFIESFKLIEINYDVKTSEIIEGQIIDSTEDIYNQKVYVLNFNYTNTFSPYLQQIRESKKFRIVEENHIHGQLNNPNNPIIFGFGDEYNRDYLHFEEQGNNDVFENVKSYHYLKTDNYTNLIRFLDQGKYRVFILGHSCGLSDRTMFKEIFDHENCKSVRIFHYTDRDGKNDFFDKSINLGRHFSNKGRMRRLVTAFNPADSIPQYVDFQADMMVCIN